MRSVRDAAVCGGSGAGRDHRCDQSLHISKALTPGIGETRFATRCVSAVERVAARSSRASAMTTLAPNSADASALLRPIPEAAPVTSATAP